jgi:hypothetical protein
MQGAAANAITGENPLAGAAFGAGTNGLLGAAGARYLSAPSRAQMLPKTAEAARAYGGTLPVGPMVAGSVGKEISGIAGQGGREAVEQFNQKLLDETGASAIAHAQGKLGIDSDVFKATKKMLSDGYDFFGASHQVTFDQKAQQEILAAYRAAANDLRSTRPEAVVELGKQIKQIVGAGIQDPQNPNRLFLRGSDFLSLTKPGGAIDQIYTADKRLTPYAAQIKQALRDALERTDPQALATVNTLDKQWKNLHDLAPAISKLPDGLMSPPQVAQTLKKKTGGLADIADIGQYLPVPLPSGDVKAAGKIASGAKLIGGGALAVHAPEILGAMVHHPWETGAGIVGAGLAYGAKHLYGNYLNSPGYFNKVVDQSLAPSTHYAINPLTAVAPTWTQGK